jgi:FeS assembly SUF system protein
MSASPFSPEDARPRIAEALATVFDPEIPVNIYELGLIYGIDIDTTGGVSIRMTLTSPSCPSAQMLPRLVQSRVAAVPGVAEARVEVVWDPPWSPDRMSEAARLELGLA